MATSDFGSSVFINCPFDERYWPMLEAIVFAIVACGFKPRCALEDLDSGAVRIERLRRLIGSCGLGIHDLSRVELDTGSRLPRFNMPFELGVDTGARAFGGTRLNRKRFLVLDSKPYRYQAFLSDLSGQDIRCHNDVPETAIDTVRNWLRACTPTFRLPGPMVIRSQFREFSNSLDSNCERNGLDRGDLLFIDLVDLARQWVTAAGLPRGN